MSKAKLFLASDHAGFEHKNTLRDYLETHDSHGYEIVDVGAHVYDESDDYPQFISEAARCVSLNPTRDKAVIFGGSGQGEAIVANKYFGVRATVYYGGEPSIIALAREHNNANILSIGARFVSEKETITRVQEWLVTKYKREPRHERRIAQINTLEDRRFWKRFMSLVRRAKQSIV